MPTKKSALVSFNNYIYVTMLMYTKASIKFLPATFEMVILYLYIIQYIVHLTYNFKLKLGPKCCNTYSKLNWFNL